MRKKRLSPVEALEIQWDNISGQGVGRIALLWVEQNVKHNMRRYILELFSKKETLSLKKIDELVNKHDKMTKAGVLKNLDYLVSANALTSMFISTNKGRERTFTITSEGKTMVDLCKISDLLEDIRFTGLSK